MANQGCGEVGWRLSSGARRRLKPFLEIFGHACAHEPPPYGETWYAEAYGHRARSEGWLAASFLAYAHEEAIGSTRLLTLARTAGDDLPQVARLAKKHAADEIRHIRYFLELRAQVFPHLRRGRQAANPNNLPAVAQPTCRSKRLTDERLYSLCREIIRINIGEIKNRVHLSCMRTWALRHSPRPNHHAVDEITKALITDETRHIIYTGYMIQLMVNMIPHHDLISAYLDEFTRFNRIITNQLSNSRLLPRKQTADLPCSTLTS